MKKKYLFILCFTLMLFSSFEKAKADVESRRAELIKVLDEELKEVVRLNKQTGGNRPDLMLRMGQVLLEKGRLLKEQENQKYLEVPSDKRDQIKLDEHFKESKRYFDQAQKTVLVLLKKFPKFEDRADAYYILAYNAKELKQEDESKKFFQKAIDDSRADSLIGSKSRIALAEMYFNKGSYDKSMNLYEAALSKKRDKWWTKDAFNLSWSYFKMGKFDKAIELMNEAYELSKSNKYIDMSKSIERDIAFFYTEAGRSNEAVQFYKKNGKNVTEILFKVGRYLKTQGKYTIAEKTLTDALQLKSTDKEELEINLELLSLYEKFGRYEKHLEACKLVAVHFDKGGLNNDQIEVLKYNVQKIGALLQQQVVAKTFDHQIDIRDKKVDAAADYFSIEAKIDPKKAEEALFHAGETYFAVEKYDKAVAYYAEAIKVAQKNGNKKIETSAGSAMLVCLGKGVKKETSDKYLIPAYESYLAANPKGEKSGIVYQRLFSANLEKKDIVGAEKALLSYHVMIPSDSDPQEKMIAKVMDYYKEKGDKTALLNWTNKIENKEFNVSPQYSAKVHELILGMQFEKVEVANSKGDKKAALKGYFQIYKAPDSTSEAKKMAAYNIAVLFYELGDSKQMYNWADKSVGMMTPQDIQKFEKDLIIFSTDLFQRRQFTESANLSEKSFDKLCTTDSKNKKVFYKNANVIFLSERQFDKSRALFSKGQNCKLPKEVINGGYLDHLNELALSNKWTSFNEIIKNLESNKEIWGYLIYPISLLANELENIGKVDESRSLNQKINIYYDYAKKQKVEIPLEGLDAVAQLRIGTLEEQLKQFKTTKLKFPEKEYNKLLKQKFSKLEQITNMADSIAEIGSGVGILKAYRIVIEGEESLRSEILNFTPPDKTEEYIKSFKSGMKNLVAPLDKQILEFKELALSKISKENILSKDNYWFLATDKDTLIPMYFNTDSGALMDKAGAK